MHLRNILILLTFLNSSLAQSHGGGTIKKGPLVGCHQDHKRGIFHCHSKSTHSGQSFSSKEAAMKAMSGSTSLPSSAAASKIYNRKSWGQWADSDGDCVNTRNEILKERSLTPVIMDGCRVIKGRWSDYYYFEVLTNSSDIDIDHLVPVYEAHQSGAQDWSAVKKREFYNDPENLVITNLTYNRQKGSKTIAEWLPINRQYACKYYKDWMKIKKKYKLTISESEKKAIDAKACQ